MHVALSLIPGIKQKTREPGECSVAELLGALMYKAGKAAFTCDHRTREGSLQIWGSLASQAIDELWAQ